MEFLAKKIHLIILSFIIFYSCGKNDTVTETIKLKTDTFISSYNNYNNSNLNYLQISKSSSQEDRIILKLPTNDYGDNFFDKCFDNENLCAVFLLPIYIVVKILSSCAGKGLDSSNLTSAILIMNTNDSSSITAGALSLSLLTKPWWHTTNWTIAHPFSSKGRWSSPGGDIDQTETFETNCNNLSTGSCSSDEIKFELTNYFKTLLDGSSKNHYGMIVSANSDISSSTIYSVQANSALSPRIVATYTCNNSFAPETKIFYLGSNL